jgi:hypothetical protein
MSRKYGILKTFIPFNFRFERYTKRYGAWTCTPQDGMRHSEHYSELAKPPKRKRSGCLMLAMDQNTFLV